MSGNISTLGRYIYLNIYAYLLLFMGIGIAFIPFYRLHWLLLVPQVIAALLLLNASAKIFKNWKSKKRSYNVLMERNRDGLRDDTFKEYMQAPCGRLLVRIVLSDLGESGQYRRIRKMYRMSLRDTIKTIRESWKPKRTVVYVIKNGNEQKEQMQ